MTKSEQIIHALQQFKGDYLGDGVASNVNRKDIILELQAQQAEIASLKLLLRAAEEKADQSLWEGDGV